MVPSIGWGQSKERLRSPVLLAVMLAAEKAETSRGIPSRLFLVVFAEMVVFLPFPVAL
jgi:hypothetical protein